MDTSRAIYRGFLFKTKEGKWVLSREPDLKSCCVGTQAKAETQIFLEGDFSNEKINAPLSVTGVLIYNTRENQKILTEVHIVKEPGRSTPIFTIGLGLLVLFLFFSLKKIMKKRKQRTQVSKRR